MDPILIEFSPRFKAAGLELEDALIEMPMYERDFIFSELVKRGHGTAVHFIVTPTTDGWSVVYIN